MQRQITRKWYKIELYLQWQTNRKPYILFLIFHVYLDLTVMHMPSFVFCVYDRMCV